MAHTVETWIVVADGAGARIFEEGVRLGALRERAAPAPATLRRIEVCHPHERHGEDAGALRTRLQTLRAAA